MTTEEIETRPSHQEDAAPMSFADNSILAGYPDIGNPKDVSDALKIPESSVRALCRTKDLRAFKVGNLWRVPKAWLQEFILKGDC